MVAFINALSVDVGGSLRQEDVLDDKLDVLTGRGVEILDISTKINITPIHSYHRTLTCLSCIRMSQSLPRMPRMPLMIIFDVQIHILAYYRISFIM